MGEPQKSRGTPSILLCYEKIRFYRHKLEWDDGASELMTRTWRENLQQWESYWLEKAIAIHYKHHPRAPLPENPYTVAEGELA